MSKIRLNDLARELEVKTKAILDVLLKVGVTEKKTHSSSVEEFEAEKIRAYFRTSGEESFRARRIPSDEEIKTKIDLSLISRRGDVLRAITPAKQTPASSPTRSAAPQSSAPPEDEPVGWPLASIKADAPVAPPPQPTAMPLAPRIVTPPVARTMTAAAPPAKPSSDRQHIIDIDSEELDTGSEELELIVKYKSYEEGMTSSEPFPIPHKFALPEVKDFANALFHELHRLNTVADNRPPILTELKKSAGKLYEKLIPPHLSRILETETEFAYLVFELPADLAWIPWELLWDPKKQYFLCQAFKVSRRLKKAGIEFMRAESRRREPRSGRALILSGDTSSPKLEANWEKQEVTRYFDQLFSQRVWAPQAETRSDVFDWLKQDYDICHFIGHGKFVAEDPLQSGWILRDDSVLTCKEIETHASRRAVFPLLIFANSCDSASSVVTDSEAYVQLLYHAFLRLGVPHYIGTITKIQDHFKDANGEEHYPAAEFARDFYRSLAAGSRVGEALGIARREAFAKPGTPIWASYVHYGDPAFQFVDKPIAAQKVLKPRLVRASLPTQPTYRDIFVGRSRELGLMRESLQILADGKSSILLVTGEAGSGKSALVRHFVLDAKHSLEPVGAATGTCQKGVRHDANTLLRDMMEQLLQCPGKLLQPQREALTVCELVLSELLDFPLLVSLCRPDVILGADRFHRICERLGWDRKGAPVAAVPADEREITRELKPLLHRISEAVPLILVVEDLQWADDSSLELFRQLCKPLSHSRVLVLGTYRSHCAQPGRTGMALEDILHEARRYGARSISLDRLTGKSDADSKNSDQRRILSFVITYLRRALPIVSAKQRPGMTLVDTLVEYTGGNAFFVAELVECLRRTDAICVGGGGQFYEAWNFRDRRPNRLELPGSVQALIEDRITELNRDSRHTLKVASILGRDFSLEALVYLLQHDENTVRSHLDDFIHIHRLIEELEETEKRTRTVPLSMFRFRSRAIQAYIHDQLSGTDQRRLHKKAGEYLENLPSEDREQWGSELATHFFISQEWPKAFRYSWKAARSKSFDSYERVLQLENTLSLLKRVPAEERHRMDLENELEKAIFSAGESEEFDYYFQKLYCLRDPQDLRAELRFYEEHQDLDESGEHKAAIRRALCYPLTPQQIPKE
jgi:CHAT domain-containing protein